MHEPRIHPILALPLALGLAGATALPRDPAPQDGGIDAQALFLANCATCHGEAGDGQGVTELDRPARSFKDGGFSFGNTPEAIFRTVTYGIPGSPMPAFGTAFGEAERKALADYVIALGPGLPPAPENTEMVVGERALVVRGMLPPLTQGVVLQPRGLAIGLPSGMTFEYRTDDVRLLGIRQGRFVDRTDWVGRGGTPLAPLGQVVHTFEGGDPGPAFHAATEQGELALVARFKGTWVRGERAGLRYDLLDEGGARVARVDESCESLAVRSATGFRRSLSFSELTDGPPIAMRAFDQAGGSWEATGPSGYRVREDGRLECYFSGGTEIEPRTERGALSLLVRAPTPDSGAMIVTTLVSNDPAPADAEARRLAFEAIRTEVLQ